MSDLAACTPAWRRRVSAYHDGGLPSPERSLVEDHLRDCLACQHVLASYDQIFRELRALPGFEGLLTITKPGTRRGMGGTMRPSFTWPGKNTSSNVGPLRDNGRPTGGGPIILSLLVLLALAFLVGRTSDLIVPQAQSMLTHTAPTPTLAAFTANGVLCANVDQTTHATYLSSDNHGHIVSVADCGASHPIATVTPTDLQFEALSPDNAKLLVTSPALTTRKAGQRTHLYVLTLANGDWREVGLSPDGVQAPYSADEVGWQNASTFILRSGTTVAQVDLVKHTVTPLGINATHIAVRGTTLFYSSVLGGRATLHRRVLGPPIVDDVVLALGAGTEACTTPTCWQTIPWDVSADGKLVAYPTPVPTQPLTATATNATLILQNLPANTHTTLGTLKLSTAPMAVSIAPTARFVAVIGQTATAPPQLLVFKADGSAVRSDVVYGRCAWRPDGSALVAMPFIPSTTEVPHLINVVTGSSLNLTPLTTNYLWES
ncbi:MAG: zf-HC2 domain-containing protein [Ktedonobacterales bacterium]|nr:zf-HC2 domain-containing protein [Ktedonobacterales bacterium]